MSTSTITGPEVPDVIAQIEGCTRTGDVTQVNARRCCDTMAEHFRVPRPEGVTLAQSSFGKLEFDPAVPCEGFG